METEKVYSPVKDGKIKRNLNDSPIWKNCYKQDEVTSDVLKKHNNIFYIYSIKFDGLKPVQVTKVETF